MANQLFRCTGVITIGIVLAALFVPSGELHAQTYRPPKVVVTSPAQSEPGTALSPDFRVKFGAALRPSSISPSNFSITGSRSGLHTATVSYDPDELTAALSLDSPFIYGETVQAIVKRGGVTSQSGGLPIVSGYSWKFTTGVSNGTCEFTADALTYTGAGAPAAVAAADFNRDGYTDLAATNSSGSVDVFMNTARQRLAFTGSYALGSAGAGIVTADLDGNGTIDVAAANSGTVSALLNNGSGALTLSSSLSAGASITSIAAADLDNDGAVDLAVTDASDNTVIFLKNDGSGSFSIMQSIGVGRAPSGIALEDLNNDGMIDALVCNRASNNVWLLKNSSAVFAKDTIYHLHTAPAAIVSYDFDNDGYPDLAAANSGTNDVSVMLNDKKGRFIGPGDFDLVGDSPVALAGGDFDGDGDIDLAVACPGSNSIAIMQNNGYSFPTVKTVPAGAAPTGVAVLDMSGVYGILDVASANSGSGTVSILKNAFFAPPPAVLTLSETAIDFPPTAVGASTESVIRMSAGFSPLTVDSVVSVSNLARALGSFPITISSYESVDVPFAFSPADFGSASDVLTVYSSAGPQQIRITGTSPVPAAEIDIQTIDFGACKIGTPVARSFSVKNRSLNAFALSSASTHTRWFASHNPSHVVLPNDSLGLTVTFTADRFGSFLDTLFIATNTDRPIIPIVLQGHSPVPVLVLSAPSSAFGAVKLQTPTVRQIMLSNPSLNTVSIDSLSTGNGAFAAAIQRRTIARDETLAVTLTFTPPAMQSYLDTLVIINTSDRRSIPVALSGDSPVPAVSVSTQVLSYGNVKVAQNASRKLVLKNSSLNDVVIDTALAATRFFTPATVKGRIADGDSLVIAVAFSPDTLGAYADTLRLRTNTITPQIPIALAGNSPIPTLNLSAQSVQFGNVRLGDTATVKLVLWNQSFNDVVIDTIAGRTNSFRPAAAKCRIAQSDSFGLALRFLPDRLEAFADTIVLVTNSDRKRIPVAVWGNSPRPELTLSATQIDFGSVGVKQSVAKSVLLTNASLNTASIDSFRIRTRVFAISRRAQPIVLTTGDTVSAIVTFTPDSTLQYGDTLYVYSAQLRAPAAVMVMGKGEPVTSVDRLYPGIPEKYALNQNYPNPFNPVTTIQFAVPQPSFITIKVYDVTGREIAEVFRNSVMAGYYSMQWNARGIASGIYLYRMRAVALESRAVYNETRKLVVVK